MTAQGCWCGGQVTTEEGLSVCLDSAFHDPHATGRPTVIRRLYVAGPMSGYPLNNYPEFHRVSDLLRGAGYEAVNPAETGVPDKGRVHYTDLLRQDLIDMMGCDGVAVIDLWWESQGAMNEVHVAGILKMPVHHYDTWIRMGTESSVTHACPPGSEGVMPCCGRTPFEVPRTDRMTVDPAMVSCRGLASQDS